MSHRYRLKYVVKFEPGEFCKHQAEDGDEGLADAMICISILYPENGTYSILPFSLDGRTSRPLEPHEEFKAWLVWGFGLLGRRLFPEDDWRQRALWTLSKVVPSSERDVTPSPYRRPST